MSKTQSDATIACRFWRELHAAHEQESGAMALLDELPDGPTVIQFPLQKTREAPNHG